jgi:hypothetical protein
MEFGEASAKNVFSIVDGVILAIANLASATSYLETP